MRRARRRRLAVALVLPAAATAAAATAYATVAVTVANVWAVPGTATIPNDFHVWPTPGSAYEQRRALVGHMPTQVLYGERVVVLERSARWTKIAVPDQPSPLDPRGYPGWVLELAAAARRAAAANWSR